MMSAATSYDEVPYDCQPRYAMHPDCLATLGTLLGMAPARAERCRVLELGCATGANLIPLAAALPESRFVGIDLSPIQIEQGRRVSAAVGLTNIELRPGSILDVDESLGSFDYLLCHGVYSWVPAAVQDKILAICQRHLSPQGIAYVSYNTYPGWHARAMVRDMLAYHVKQFAEPAQRIEQARAFLGFMLQAVPEPDSIQGRIMRAEAALLSERADYYLFHEHLEDDNHPVYFHEFMSRAAARGLQYLGEPWQHGHWSQFRPEVKSVLQRLAGDLIQLEQYLDFLRHRSFRRTLLCRDNVQLQRQPPPELVATMRISALVRPLGPATEPASTDAEDYKSEAGPHVSTNMPMLKAALRVLVAAWPGALTFPELWQAVRARVGPAIEPGHEPQLQAALLEFYLANVVALHVAFPHFVRQASERPCAGPLTLHQAATGAPIVSRRHAQVPVEPFDRAVLSLLSGQRTRSELIDGLMSRSGTIDLAPEAPPPADSAALRRFIEPLLEPALERLASLALLVG